MSNLSKALIGFNLACFVLGIAVAIVSHRWYSIFNVVIAIVNLGVAWLIWKVEQL